MGKCKKVKYNMFNIHNETDDKLTLNKDDIVIFKVSRENNALTSEF